MLPDPGDLPEMEIRVFNSGWVPANEKVVLSGGPSRSIRMPALFAMFRRPGGVTLYDTGYNTSFYEATRRFPYRIMRYITPAEISDEQNAGRQLERAGVAADEVDTIILGHGHVDHVPGIWAFPRAKVVVSASEWEAMQGPALKLFTRGYLKSLYDGLPNEIETIDLEDRGSTYGPFRRAADLFGDGSMILVPLPGHTAGQMGLLANMADGRRFFFIGDAAWVRENYLDLRPPSVLARTILASKTDYLKTLETVRDFHLERPEVIIVPAHCPAAWEELKGMGVAE